ncbi:uncharacterized protein LOC5516714 [Nematostella vectensis]|uniref:uncharacterized protein LOC5516714 n=1 Tax=Nematostella vectensis TaxID=45351 RepID=UPI00207724F1|nr:uncharacterized protein LOC5516714 [Nematostella vectensis]
MNWFNDLVTSDERACGVLCRCLGFTEKETFARTRPFCESHVLFLKESLDTMKMSHSMLLALALCCLISGGSSAITCSQVTGYQSVKQGCRVDLHRGLNILFDIRRTQHYDETDVVQYNSLLCQCMQKAMDKNHMWFAVEKMGICFTKDVSLSTYLTELPLDVDKSCDAPFVPKSNLTHNGVPCFGGEFRAMFYKIQSSMVASNSDETPQESPLEAPLESPIESPIEKPLESPLESPLEAPLEAPLKEPVLTCSNKADVAIFVDVSGSIGPVNLVKEVKYIEKFFDRFDFTSQKTRVALAEFDVDARFKLDLVGSEARSLAQIREIAKTQFFFTGSWTRTDVALGRAVELFTNQQKEGVPKTLVLMTDGRAWLDQTTFKNSINALKNLNVNVVAIAVGSSNDIDLDNLYEICGSLDKVIQLDGYDTLVSSASSTLDKLVKSACVL